VVCARFCRRRVLFVPTQIYGCLFCCCRIIAMMTHRNNNTETIYVPCARFNTTILCVCSLVDVHCWSIK
jgi:hypothetical protein